MAIFWGQSPTPDFLNTLLPIVGQKRYTIGTWIANGDRPQEISLQAGDLFDQ